MRLKILGLALLCGGLVQSSFGSIITNGTFTITGTVYVVNNGTTSATLGSGLPTCSSAGGCIYWQSGATVTTNRADISTAGLPSGTGPGLIPAALAGNDAATISNLTNPPNLVGSPGFTNQTFITFNSIAGLTTSLMINFISPGIDGVAGCSIPLASAAPGQICTPTGSLFNFQNLTNPAVPPIPSALSSATWTFGGVTAGNLPGTPESVWFGSFTSQFNFSYQQVLTNLANNGFVADTYSGTITLAPVPPPPPGTPEPASVFMIGSGLLGLGVFMRRRTARQ